MTLLARIIAISLLPVWLVVMSESVAVAQRSCPPGKIWDNHTGRCEIVVCKSGHRFNIQKSVCERARCSKGKTWSAKKQACIAQSSPSQMLTKAVEYLVADNPNIPAGTRLVKLSCKSGEPRACRLLGWIYNNGIEDHVSPDVAKSNLYYQKARARFTKNCRDGDKESCYIVGVMYEEGDGTAQDLSTAHDFFEQACTGKNLSPDGCLAHGKTHYFGNGTDRNIAVALRDLATACRLELDTPCKWLDQIFREVQTEAKKLSLTNEQIEFLKEWSFDSIKIACNQMVDGACVEQGRLLAFGSALLGKPRPDEAVPLFEIQCRRANQNACLMLGVLYQTGTGVVEDKEKAKALYTDLCNGNLTLACVQLGAQLYSEKSYETALSVFLKACEASTAAQIQAGSGDACNMVGFAYYTAQGAPWDVKKALEFYQRGCDMGSAVACSNLGEMYEYGIGVTKKRVKALQFYRKGCTVEASVGCTAVGRFYQSGEIVVRDMKRAGQHYLRNCNDNSAEPYAEACRLLADYYTESNESSQSEIARLYQKAFDLAKNQADLNPYGHLLLGRFYQDGVSVMKDIRKAAEHFSLACERYDPVGCLKAGQVYMGNAGIAADYARAVSFFDRGCAAGIAESCELATTARKKARKKWYNAGCASCRASDGGLAPIPWGWLLAISCLLAMRFRGIRLRRCTGQ